MLLYEKQAHAGPDHSRVPLNSSSLAMAKPLFVYDKGRYHYQGTFPAELPPRHGYTHIAFFMAWLVNNDLVSRHFLKEAGARVEKLRSREILPHDLIEFWDETLDNYMLTKEGDAFAAEYYKIDTGQYVADYEQTLCSSLPTLYHVEPTWANFDKLAPVISGRYEEFRKRRQK